METGHDFAPATGARARLFASLRARDRWSAWMWVSSDPSNSTAMLLRKIRVDRRSRPKRSITAASPSGDDRVREASLSGPPNLDDAGGRVANGTSAVFHARLQAFMPPASDKHSIRARSACQRPSGSCGRHCTPSRRAGLKAATASCSGPGWPLRRASYALMWTLPGIAHWRAVLIASNVQHGHRRPCSSQSRKCPCRSVLS